MRFFYLWGSCLCALCRFCALCVLCALCRFCSPLAASVRSECDRCGNGEKLMKIVAFCSNGEECLRTWKHALLPIFFVLQDLTSWAAIFEGQLWISLLVLRSSWLWPLRCSCCCCCQTERWMLIAPMTAKMRAKILCRACPRHQRNPLLTLRMSRGLPCTALDCVMPLLCWTMILATGSSPAPLPGSPDFSWSNTMTSVGSPCSA